MGVEAIHVVIYPRVMGNMFIKVRDIVPCIYPRVRGKVCVEIGIQFSTHR